MAITMSDATVNTSGREELLSSNVNGDITAGGATANKSGGFFGLGAQETGVALAGITQEFSANVSGKIDEYIANVKDTIAAIEQAESNEAFQGSQVSSALSKFVESIKNVANSYLDRLKEAENQIISSVSAAYAEQDSDLSTNMNSDSENLQSSNTSASAE